MEIWFAISVMVPLWILGGYAALLLFDPARGWHRPHLRRRPTRDL